MGVGGPLESQRLEEAHGECLLEDPERALDLCMPYVKVDPIGTVHKAGAVVVAAAVAAAY